MSVYALSASQKLTTERMLSCFGFLDTVGCGSTRKQITLHGYECGSHLKAPPTFLSCGRKKIITKHG